MNLENNIIGGVVAGLILYWLLRKDKPSHDHKKSTKPHSGRPAAFRDVVRPPCGC